MKLSIVTINYNNTDGSRKTLASVSSQTYRDIEHIVIDGASTDGSVDVIKSMCLLILITIRFSSILLNGFQKEIAEYIMP